MKRHPKASPILHDDERPVADVGFRSHRTPGVTFRRAHRRRLCGSCVGRRKAAEFWAFFLCLASAPIPFNLSPFYFVLACLAGWMNREQQQLIEYIQAE